MPFATVSTKGQITLPANARKALGIKAHGRVFIQTLQDAIVVRAAPDFFALKGFLGRSLPPEEARRRMAEGVAKHVLEKE